jgi:YVTN family beta-propeller protein
MALGQSGPGYSPGSLISVGTAPNDVAVDDADQLAFVAGQNATITTINLSTNTVAGVRTLASPVTSLVYDAPRHQLVALTAAGRMGVYSIPSGAAQSLPAAADELTVDPGTGVVYGLDTFQGRVGTVDLTTGALQHPVDLALPPLEMAFDSSTGLLWVLQTEDDDGNGIIFSAAARRAAAAAPNATGELAVLVKPATGTVVGQVTVPSDAATINIDSAAHRAYLSRSNGRTLAAVDTQTRQLVAPIDLGSGDASYVLDVNPARHLLVAATVDIGSVLPSNPRLVTVDTATGVVTHNNPVPSSVGLLDRALLVGDGSLLTLSFGTDSVARLSPTDATVQASISVGLGGAVPVPEAIDATAHRLYVGNVYSHNISVIDTGTQQVIGSFNVPDDVLDLVVDPAAHRLYALYGQLGSTSQSVAVLDTTSGATLHTFSYDGLTTIALDAADHRLYGAALDGEAIVSYDTATDTLLPAITVLSGVDQVTVDAADHRAYFGDAEDDVVVLNTLTNKVIATVPMSSDGSCGILGLVADPALDRLYVDCYDDVRVVDIARDVVSLIAPEDALTGLTVDPASHALIGMDIERPGLEVLSPSTLTNVSRVALDPADFGQADIVQDPATGRLYTSETQLNGVRVLDPVALTAHAPAIFAQPKANVVLSRHTATFTVGVSSTPVSTVQWYQSIGGAPGAPLIGQGMTTLHVYGAAANSGKRYYAIVHNAAGTVRSNEASLTVATAPKVLTQPASVVAAAGHEAVFRVVASAVPAATIQWQVTLNGGRSWVSISGAKYSSYGVVATAATNGRYYRAVLHNVAGTTATRAAKLVTRS